MYEVALETSAAKSLRKIPEGIVDQITAILQDLAREPRPSGCRKIVGSESDYRIRFRDYRVLYGIDDAQRKVFVYAIGHRKDVYRH